MGLKESEGEIIKVNMIQNEVERLAKPQNSEFGILNYINL